MLIKFIKTDCETNLLHYKKSLGQNFLIDKNISIKIVKLINNFEKKNIIEIGPGTGALTEIIFNKKPKRLILIEKDKSLYEKLFTKYKNNKSITIYNEDALNFNYAKIDKPKSIIANLPYNISIKLIINWMKNITEFNEIVVMIQKEVAQKMNYKNTNKMNRLNILTAIYSNFNIEFNVSNNVFFPKPKITSSVIKLTPKKKLNYDFSKLENFTRLIFRYKRKKLLNVIPKEKLVILKLKNNSFNFSNILNSRAEDLSLEKIIILFKAISQI